MKTIWTFCLMLAFVSSLAVAQLVNQRPITTTGEMLIEIKAATTLTVVASRLSPELLNKFFLTRRDFNHLILITDGDGFKTIDPYCHVIRFQYFKSIYTLPRLPQDGVIRVDRGNDTKLIQGPLVLGVAGATRLLEGDPMARTIAIQMLEPLLQQAEFKYDC